MALEESLRRTVYSEGFLPGHRAVSHGSRGLSSVSPRHPQHDSQRCSIVPGCAGCWVDHLPGVLGPVGRPGPRFCPAPCCPECGCHLSGPVFPGCRRALASTAPSQCAHTSLRAASPGPGQALVVRDAGSTQRGVLRTSGREGPAGQGTVQGGGTALQQYRRRDWPVLSLVGAQLK